MGAVSDKNYTVDSKFNNCMDNEYEVRKIKYVRLDDFMEENNLPKPHLVKVDIEGMETLALHGMKNLLENIRPIWAMGYHYKFYSTVEGYPGWVDVEDGGFDFIIDKRNMELKQTVGGYEAVMNDIQREAENAWVSMKNIAHMSQSLPNPRKIGEKE